MEEYVKIYYEQQPSRKPLILEKSDQDLELEAAFTMVDFTVTVPGRQYLYDRLKRPLDSLDAITRLENELQRLDPEAQFRLQFGEIAKVLAGQDSADLPYLIFGGDLKSTWYYKWVPYLQVAMGLAVVLSIFFHFGLLILIGLFGFNLYLHFHNKMVLDTYRRSLNSVITLYDACGKLNKVAGDLFMQDNVTLDAYTALKPLRKRLSINQSLQLFTSSELYMLPWLLYELIKAFTLVEVRAASFIVKEVNFKKALIHHLYKTVAKTDFLWSIIKLREACGCCIPVFTTDINQASILGLYHPLIENCIINDFVPGKNAVLITGSNAAGKSTFLRSLALSNLLATSIHTCFARQFKWPLLTTLAVMHHTDRLTEGLSHYQSEVKDMGDVFKLSKHHPCLLLFDEPFNGTNSRERIAIAASVLQYFASCPSHITLIATHDFELLQLLSETYKMYYFNEQVHPDGKLSFDYRLKAGRKITRNALELIRIEGFPERVVARANQIYQQMEDKNE
ncbi:MutS family DNA mismatch repair protein [Arachidicoccus ginsenosidivorans]